MSKEKDNEFELRSEKVRNIVGEVPSYILRYGAYMVSGFLIIIFISLYLIPYSESYTTEIIIKTIPGNELIYSNTNGYITFVADNNEAIKKNEKIGIIKNNALPDGQVIFSNISGKIYLNFPSNSFINKQSLICEIIPDTIKDIYGEINLPLKYRNINTETTKIEIYLYDGSFLNGYISRLYSVNNIINKPESFKAEIKFKEEYIFTSQINGVAKIYFSQKRLLDKILDFI